MMLRTHLAVAVFLILIFLQSVSNKIVFVPIVLLATFLPDIDTGFSSIGKMKGFNFVHNFTRHRGMLHSLTFCIIVCILIAGIFPVAAFPFFLGYAFHLLLDSFTVDGIMPFWPLRQKSSWKFKTGGIMETSFFVSFIIIDIFLFFVFYLKGF